MVNFPFKEDDCSSRGVLHSFECFGGDPIETRRLSLFQLVYGSLDFAECDGIIHRGHTWLLLKEIKDGIINRSVIVEHISKMCSKHWHVSFAFDANSPPSRCMDMLRLVLWCARHGSILISWVFSHIPLYQRAFANSTRLCLCLLMVFSWAWIYATLSGLS